MGGVGQPRLTVPGRGGAGVAALAALAALAAAEQTHYQTLRERLVALGADPEEAMAPFVEPLDSWQERTAPQSWLESLVKTYVGDGIANDFYRKVAGLADEETADLVNGVLAETGRAGFVADTVRAALDEDPKLALSEGVLALQLHAGAPMWVEFKNIRLKDLKK